jgi:hypothetical protein
MGIVRGGYAGGSGGLVGGIPGGGGIGSGGGGGGGGAGGQSGPGWRRALRKLDAFPKVTSDFATTSASGGAITLAAAMVMAVLFLNEAKAFFAPEPRHQLTVDTTRDPRLDVRFDLTFPRLPCAWLTLDVMDASGEMHLDVESHDVHKERLERDTGKPVAGGKDKHELHHPVHVDGAPTRHGPGGTADCGSCYGAEDAAAGFRCCNSCDDVKAAYAKRGWVMKRLLDVDQCAHDGYVEAIRAQEGEGCRLHGHVAVKRMSGNFHVAAGRAFQSGSVHTHDLSPFEGKAVDFSHVINHLSFGPTAQEAVATNTGTRHAKGPLEGSRADDPEAAKYAAALARRKGNGASPPFQAGVFQYHLKVVPAEYVTRRNQTVRSAQYSVTETYKPAVGPDAGQGRSLPGVFFFYEPSAVRLSVQEARPPFLGFLANACAIVGGVFAVSGMLDAGVYHTQRVVKKKLELGKFS